MLRWVIHMSTSKHQPTKRVIGIIRVSTPGQATEDKFGIARQRHDIEQAAKAHGLDVIRVVEVVESGSTAFRGEDFRQVFEDLAKADIAGAVVSSIDRLVRPGFLGDLQVFDPFQRHGKVLFLPSGEPLDPRTDGGYLMAGIFGMSAGLEKRAILKRTLAGKERARAAGKHPGGQHMLPRGLEYVRERDADGKVKAYWKYGEDAARVKKAYDLLFAGMSFEDIAQAVGFRTGRGVAYILRNTVWKGIRTFEPNESRAMPLEMPMGITPLISPQRWAKAQAILDRKRTETRGRLRQDRKVSLGLGLLRCRCGRFHYLRRDYRPGEHDLYYCASRFRNARYKGESCGAPSIRRAVADAAILEAITAFGEVKTLRTLVEQALQKPTGKPQPAARTRREIARATGERDRLIDLRVKGKITEEQFDQRDRKLAGELRDLEALLPKPEPVLDPRVLASAIAGLFAEFPYLPPEEQYALARRVFIAFDVAEGGGIDTAVMRGEFLAQLHAKNGKPSRWSCSRRCREPGSRSRRS
jgi:DNA invertase Pin-like site-specific DNA recombinase